MRPSFRPLIFGLLVLVFGASVGRAQFIWTGAGTNQLVSNPQNWQGGVAPTGAGGEDLTFSAVGGFFPDFGGAFSIRHIDVTSNDAFYFLSGSGPLTLTGDVTTQQGTGPFLVFSAPLILAAGDHYFSLGGIEVSGATVYLFGDVSGSGNLLKYGKGDLVIDHSVSPNTLTGTVDLQDGRVFVHGNGALGTGLIKMNGGTLIASDTYTDTLTSILPNDLSLSANSWFGDYGNKGYLTFTGTTTIQGSLPSNEARMHVLGLGLLTLGDIGETDAGTKLIFDFEGTTRIAGNATYTGGTQTENTSVLIFAGAVPTMGNLTAIDNSYIGSEQSASVQTGFIDRFDKTNTTGIIGFDTPNLASPITISGPIDLTGFDSWARLGTATAAVFSGTITPQSSVYQFGGRGVLTVSSNLDLDGDLQTSDGLLLYLTGTNTYAGLTVALTGSAIVFNSAGAMPGGTQLWTETGSYIGYTESTGLTAAGFLGQFDIGHTTGVIGFDAANPLVGRTVTDDIDLATAEFDYSAFIGTATNVTLTGSITPAGSEYRFTGFRDGHLTVNSNLVGTGYSAVIGLDSSLINTLAPTGVTFNPSVTLNGTNTYDGGTTLQSGQLILGNSSALGTGALTVDSFSNAPSGLSTNTAGLTIANPIDLRNIWVFQVGGAFDFTLSGNLSEGYEGSLWKIGTNTLTLSGNNDGLGAAIDIRSGKIIFATDTAAGNETLYLRKFDGLSDAQAAFTSSAPTLYGLSGESDTSLDLGPGTLTLFQNSDNSFDGHITGLGNFIKDGGYTLTLTSSNTYAGTTKVKNGGIEIKGGSITHPSSDLVVGDAASDTGILTISAGGSATNLNGTVGNLAGSSGTVTVDGAGSLWTSSNSLTIAASGAGTLSITHGGHVSAYGSFLGESGVGSATVNGAGSTWTTTDEFIIGAFGTGHGYLTVSGGGTVTAGRGSIGYVAAGDVTVDGTGSSWTNTGYLYVGSATGNGHLTVRNGGTVTSNSGEIGLDSATGNAVIKGLGSTWTINTNVNVGDNLGSGVLQLFDNGRLNVNSGSGIITLGAGTGGSGTFVIGESEYSPYGGVVNAATITTGIGTGQVQFDTGATSTSPYYLTKDGTAGGSAVNLTGSLSVKNYGGYNVLTGNNTYTGGTTISGGTLVAGSSTALGTGTIVFNGGMLSLGSGVVLSNPLDLSSGGLLGGNGTIGSHITVNTGVVVSPGNSPGTLTFASGLTFAPGGLYDWQLQTVAGGAGTSTGWDLISISSGTLDLTTLTPGSFTVRLLSLDGAGAGGLVSDFNAGLPYTFTLATAAGGIVGFNAANFTIDATAFVNSPIQSYFSLSVSGNNLNLNFTPVPEPSTWALLALGLSAGGLTFWRRRRQFPSIRATAPTTSPANKMVDWSKEFPL